MPTVAEPVDQERRRGRMQYLVGCYIRNEITEATLHVSLSILKYDEFEIKDFTLLANRIKNVPPPQRGAINEATGFGFDL
jgi:hypothetical protein